MQNLSEDERRDIDEIVEALKTSKSDGDDPATAAIAANGEESVNETGGVTEEAPVATEIETPAVSKTEAGAGETVKSSSDAMIELMALQNDRLSVLSRKVDVLTRLVELILRANLEDVE